MHLFNITSAARSPQTMQPAGQPQGILSAITRTGRLVRLFVGSFIESLNPAYLTEEQKKQGYYIEPPSFSSRPVTLAMRTITVYFPKSCALVGFLLWALPRAAGSIIEVDNADTLSRIGKDPDLPLDGHYLQTADINARNVSSIGGWKKGRFFTGIYDGVGRVLSYLQNSLFVYVDGAWVNGTVIRYARIIDCVDSARFPYSELGFITQFGTESNITNNRVEYSVLWSDVSKDRSIGSLCGRCINIHFLNNTISDSYFYVNTGHIFSEVGAMTGDLYNSLADGNRVECVKIFAKSSSAGFVSALAGGSRFINTTVVSSELHGKVGKDFSGIEFGWQTNTANSVENTTACNITLNNQLINNCPENHPSTVCGAFEEPEFMGCPTPPEPVPPEPVPPEPVPPEPVPPEPVPPEPVPPEPALTEPVTAIHFSTPATVTTAGIAGLIAATAAGVYVIGSWGWACYKGQRGTKLLLAPFSNICKLVTSVTGQRCMGRDNNQPSRDNQDEICPPLHQDQGQIWPPPYTPRNAQEPGQLIQLVDYSYAITRDPPPQYTERDPMPPPVYTESSPMVDPPPDCFPYSSDNEN